MLGTVAPGVLNAAGGLSFALFGSARMLVLALLSTLRLASRIDPRLYRLAR